MLFGGAKPPKSIKMLEWIFGSNTKKRETLVPLPKIN